MIWSSIRLYRSARRVATQMVARQSAWFGRATQMPGPGNRKKLRTVRSEVALETTSGTQRWDDQSGEEDQPGVVHTDRDSERNH